MVTITWNDDTNGLDVNWKGTEVFSDLLESAKHLQLQFDPKRKVWKGHPLRYREYVDEFDAYDRVEEDEYTKSRVSTYRDTIRELKTRSRKDRLKYVPELLNREPLFDKLSDKKDYRTTFQYQDSMFYLNRNRGLAGHECGMGKSYFVSFQLSHLVHYGLIGKAIVFSSNIGILNLRNELLKLQNVVKEDEIYVVSSVDDLDRGRDLFDSEKYPYRVIVIGYDTFRIVSDHYDKVIHDRKKKVKYTKTAIPMKKWLDGKDGALFFDECHFLGTPTSLRTRSIEMVKKFFEYRYLYSATFSPVYEKMYSPLSILDTELVDGLDYYSWLGQYVELGNRFSKYAINQDTWNYERLDQLNQKLYSNYGIRRKREEYLDLPPLIHEDPILVPWGKKHRDIYEAFSYWLSEDVKQSSMANHKGLVVNFVNVFPYAMLGVENPTLLIGTPKYDQFPPKLRTLIESFDFSKHHEKVRYLKKVLSDHCDELDQKVIVYYYHPKTMTELRNELSGYHPYVVSADVDKKDRLGVVEDFIKDSKSKVLLCSIKAGSTSITVIEAKVIVFFETSFDGIDYDQAQGRIQRPGQTEVTKIYDLVMENSFDEMKLDNLMRKGAVIDGLLKKDSLEPDEWRRIFNYHS